MIKRWNIYLLFCGIMGLLFSCNIKRNVPDNRYLLVSNEVVVPNEAEVDKSEIKNVIRQRANRRSLGFRTRLRVYNTIDSTRTEKSRKRRLAKYQKKNKKRIARENKINQKRIEKAIQQDKNTYKEKVIELKDTLTPRLTFRERLKYEFGEAPVVYDSMLMETSKNQIQLFMQKKGYFQAEVNPTIKLNNKKKEVEVVYYVVPKQEYIVDSLFVQTENKVLEDLYFEFLSTEKNVLSPPFRFDSEELGEMRKSLADFMQRKGIYGFRENYINFEVDTLTKQDKILIAVDIADRIEGKGEEIREKPFGFTEIKTVTFHLLDTMNYHGNFKKEKLDPLGISLNPFDVVPTFDTLRYDWYKDGKSPNRNATFLYNGELTTKAELIEFQNYMEETRRYNNVLLTYSYNRLLNLGIFKNVKVELVEKDDYTLELHYYLTPEKRQTFSVEPKATHNNSFLGISSSLNYINRNLFRKGYKFKVSFSGGFESHPDVFGESDVSSVLNDGTRSLNTFEFGPSFELEIPRLVPVPFSALSKSQNPKTVISSAYNFQQRTDFTRQLLQFNLLWKFFDLYHTQVFTVGIPIIGGIQFVRINKTDEFEERLKEQNDLFLLNAYSNQAIYKDAAVTYSFTNSKLKNGAITFNYGFNFDMAGMIMSAITKNNPVNDDGYKEFLNQRYSQFIRLDNQFLLHHRLNAKNSLHYRLQIGGGVPLENNGPNLPFDYSFFGGGSNDNRGFSARTLGPGAYKSYLDSNRTSTQMGDMRLGASFEYRFKMSKRFEGALFTDIGNLWTFNEDPNRQGGNISKDFYRQLSVSSGVGLRLDFTFLIVRFDVGMPLRNPALPNNAKWVFQSREPYYKEVIEKWGVNPDTGEYVYKSILPNPFRPHLHVAIGYPF